MPAAVREAFRRAEEERPGANHFMSPYQMSLQPLASTRQMFTLCCQRSQSLYTSVGLTVFALVWSGAAHIELPEDIAHHEVRIGHRN